MIEGGTSSAMREKILLVLIGAVCGVFPVLISQHLQSRAQKEQQILDRQLLSLREYGNACGHTVAAVDQFIILRSMSDAGVAEDLQVKDIQSTLADLRSARNELYVAGVTANALFGTEIKTAMTSMTLVFEKGPSSRPDAKKAHIPTLEQNLSEQTETKRMLQGSADECQENIQRMKAHIARSITK